MPSEASGSLDPENLKIENWPKNQFLGNYTEPIKILAEEGLRLPYSIDTDTPVRF